MAKAIALFVGYSSNGNPIEVAQRADGVYFWREYCWNGFGRTWSKWLAYTNEVTFVTEGENQYTGEKFAIEAGKVMAWGWNTLTRCVAEKISYRLPN